MDDPSEPEQDEMQASKLTKNKVGKRRLANLGSRLFRCDNVP